VIEFPASAYTFIKQQIVVLSGQLRFSEGSQIHDMAAGDWLELGEAADCVFANAGDVPCVYFVILVRR
jgi:hypothetical protein